MDNKTKIKNNLFKKFVVGYKELFDDVLQDTDNDQAIENMAWDVVVEDIMPEIMDFEENILLNAIKDGYIENTKEGMYAAVVEYEDIEQILDLAIDYFSQVDDNKAEIVKNLKRSL